MSQLLQIRVPLIGRPIPDDGKSDVADYNKELSQLGNPTWFNVPWLYSECYLYRYGSIHSSLAQLTNNADV